MKAINEHRITANLSRSAWRWRRRNRSQRMPPIQHTIVTIAAMEQYAKILDSKAHGALFAGSAKEVTKVNTLSTATTTNHTKPIDSQI
jgi:hypothetical protein